jgi:hypothetical protein
MFGMGFDPTAWYGVRLPHASTHHSVPSHHIRQVANFTSTFMASATEHTTDLLHGEVGSASIIGTFGRIPKQYRIWTMSIS